MGNSRIETNDLFVAHHWRGRKSFKSKHHCCGENWRSRDSLKSAPKNECCGAGLGEVLRTMSRTVSAGSSKVVRAKTS